MVKVRCSGLRTRSGLIYSRKSVSSSSELLVESSKKKPGRKREMRIQGWIRRSSLIILTLFFFGGCNIAPGLLKNRSAQRTDTTDRLFLFEAPIRDLFLAVPFKDSVMMMTELFMIRIFWLFSLCCCWLPSKMNSIKSLLICAFFFPWWHIMLHFSIRQASERPGARWQKKQAGLDENFRKAACRPEHAELQDFHERGAAQ